MFQFNPPVTYACNQLQSSPFSYEISHIRHILHYREKPNVSYCLQALGTLTRHCLVLNFADNTSRLVPNSDNDNRLTTAQEFAFTMLLSFSYFKSFESLSILWIFMKLCCLVVYEHLYRNTCALNCMVGLTNVGCDTVLWYNVSVVTERYSEVSSAN